MPSTRISKPVKRTRRKNRVTAATLERSSLKLRKRWNDIQGKFTIAQVAGHVRNKQVMIKATFAPMPRKGQAKTLRYLTSVTFSGVSLVDKPDKTHHIPITRRTGVRMGSSPTFDLHMKPVAATVNTVECRCTCQDFYFVWGYALKRRHALLGSHLKPYIRKTPLPPLGYPRRNPRHILGYCKHIKALMVNLKARGVIRR